MATEKVSVEQRRQMIAEAAYFRAERRGFNGGDPLLDWVEAESEVDARLRHAAADPFIEELERRLASAGQQLQALRKKLATMKAEARAELEQDFERLARLRDTFEKRLGELRAQGEQASQKLREQAEKTWEEIAEIIRRVGARRKTARTH